MQQVSPESLEIVEAECVRKHEGSMSLSVMQGDAAPPGSRTVSRTKARHPNPGGPAGSDERKFVGGAIQGRTGV